MADTAFRDMADSDIQELREENFRLRRSLESAEDALRREVRKNMKPLVYECRKCGALNEVALTKQQAVA